MVLRIKNSKDFFVVFEVIVSCGAVEYVLRRLLGHNLQAVQYLVAKSEGVQSLALNFFSRNGFSISIFVRVGVNDDIQFVKKGGSSVGK